MKFILQSQDTSSRARAGMLQLHHGEVPTPMFMPVGTAGTVKAVHQRDLANEIHAPIILGNTYHLYLRPGLDVIRNAGGAGPFMGWQRNLLTDSGGYQVFSLAERRKITEEGVSFASHIDGSKHLFTPEFSMEIQRVLGADCIMAFDECPHWPAEEKYVAKSLALTERWLDRCRIWCDSNPEYYGYTQTLIPIIQGGTYPALRAQATEHLVQQDWKAFAIGGLSVGEPAELMHAMTDIVTNILPVDKPRYLMGLGTPENILRSIALGIDLFDCVLPSRNARHGLIYTTSGIMHIKNACWMNDHSPLDEGLDCFASKDYSKAYVRHLFQAKEWLAPMIATLQNLAFYLWLVQEARKHIQEGDYSTWMETILPVINQQRS